MFTVTFEELNASLLNDNKKLVFVYFIFYYWPQHFQQIETSHL